MFNNVILGRKVRCVVVPPGNNTGMGLSGGYKSGDTGYIVALGADSEISWGISWGLYFFVNSKHPVGSAARDWVLGRAVRLR